MTEPNLNGWTPIDDPDRPVPTDGTQVDVWMVDCSSSWREPNCSFGPDLEGMMTSGETYLSRQDDGRFSARGWHVKITHYRLPPLGPNGEGDQ